MTLVLRRALRFAGRSGICHVFLQVGRDFKCEKVLPLANSAFLNAQLRLGS